MGVLSDITDKLLSSDGREDGTPLSEIKDARDQSPDEIKLVTYIKEKIDQVRQTNSRLAIEGTFVTNLAYMLGYDSVYWDTSYKRFKNTDPKRRLSRSRFKINKILPTVQNRLARITQSPPQYDVRPNSPSTEDKDASRLALNVLENIFDKQRFEEIRQDLHLLGMEGGCSYIQVLWDDTLGEPTVDPETEEIMGYQGDVRLEVLNCLEVFPDPLAKRLDDCEWWIKAKIRKLDYFKDHYPERGGAVKEEQAWLLSATYDMKINSLTSVGIVGAQTNDQAKNSAIEIIYQEKPSKNYPNGRKIVCANGVLLHDGPLPVGEFDLVKFDDIVVGGRYYPEAVITHLRPIQDQYNVLRTKIADWVKKMLAGKYLAAKGHGLGEEALNNDSGEVVEYDPVPGAAPPMPMVIPQIPQYAYEDLETLDTEFNLVSGLNDVSQGVAPSASMPWRGMALLQEQDQARISVQTKRNEVGYAKVGALILKYVTKYYQMPRMLKLAGDELEYAVKEFMGSDLKDNTDVIVIPGSTVPNSKVLKRQDIINTYQMGLLGDPQDPKLRQKVLGMLEYGDVSEMWKEQALDTGVARKQIEAIENGQMPDLHEWDNHGLIIQEMNSYRKTDKFDDMDMRAKAMFNYVIEWHVQALIGLTNPQVQDQQVLAQQMVNSTIQMYGPPQGMGPQGPGMAGPPMPQPGSANPNPQPTPQASPTQMPIGA